MALSVVALYIRNGQIPAFAAVPGKHNDCNVTVLPERIDDLIGINLRVVLTR